MPANSAIAGETVERFEALINQRRVMVGKDPNQLKIGRPAKAMLAATDSNLPPSGGSSPRAVRAPRATFGVSVGVISKPGARRSPKRPGFVVPVASPAAVY